MNETARKALVDELHAELETAYGMRWGVDSMGVVMTIMPIIERLLAAKSLDGMLAHLGRVKSLAMVYREYEQRYRTEVVVTTPEVDDETGNVVGRFNKTYEAFGGTRDESLRNVIAKAKGDQS